MRCIFTLGFLLSFFFPEFYIHAQDSNAATEPLAIAREYVQSHLSEFGLTPHDIADMTVNDMYTDKTSGITRIYFLQHSGNIPVYNAILNISISKNGKVFFTGNRFVKDLENKINSSIPEISAAEAVKDLAAYLGLSAEDLQIKSNTRDVKFVFDKGSIAAEDITASLSFQPYQGHVNLAWDILLSPLGTSDRWSTRVDAVSGIVLNEYNWTVYCAQENLSVDRQDNACSGSSDFINTTAGPDLTGPQYNVWPSPIESPNQGPRTLVTSPSDPIASPFGWHDTNGQAGAEYTITRGNNVHAYQDRDALGHSSNDEPDGGPDLHFDFPFDPSLEPEQNIDVGVVNLFYWINYMHDFSYHFGFDEEEGNFQQNNYGRGGKGNDGLIAYTQQGANKGNSNNSYYNGSADGSQSYISMYIFKGRKSDLKVNAPSTVAGLYKTSLPSSGWGPGAYVNNVPLTGEVVFVDDGVDDPYSSDACENIINASALVGKIALIDRGGCQFGWKALQAQKAGAIAVIMCNLDDDIYTMNPGTDGANVNIPIVMLGISDCQSISKFVGNGLNVTIVDEGQVGASSLDGDLDNSLISHEFGHGICDRLIGGPSSVCLDNAEQMGEGWSDFFALATNVRPGDTGEMKRGFSTYANRDIPTGRGFRRHPYSTDMSIMPLTYGDVAPDQEVHDMGEIWASTLWDMYWAFVDKYGWKADPYDTSSGNYRAIRLVFDGLKNIPCEPGFVDGRNSILAADDALYDSEDTCMIWQVFARRGIGFSADQGSPYDAGDQKEAFDLPPACTNKVIIEKSVTDFIQPGDDIHVTIKVGNYKTEKVTHAIVTDEIPEGTSFKINSSNLPVSIQGNKVSFQLDDMNFQDKVTITYTLETNQENWSKRKFIDEVSDQNNANWLTYTIGSAASNIWNITNIYPGHTGNFCWMSQEVPERSRQALELNPASYVFHVDGNHPTLRFYHRYITQAANDGGIVEVKEISENNWQQVGDDMLRNGYTGLMGYLTFLSPDIRGFSGNSGNDFKATYVDLSKWAGKDIQIRFRFATNVNTNNGLGWLIDDIEFMNLLNYNGEACVTTEQGDIKCTTAPEAGTIVDSREEPLSATDEVNKVSLKIYPNPATDEITIIRPGGGNKDVNVSLFSTDGKQLLTESFNAMDSNQLMVNTEKLPSGLYLIKVNMADSQFVSKVIIQK